MSHQNGLPYFSAGPGYAQQPSQPHPQPCPQPQPQAAEAEDPGTMLNVYPFMTYAPTARVAQHLSSHSFLPQPSPTAHQVYPHYTQSFGRIEQPLTPGDWEMRQAADMRVRDVLEAQRQHGGSYGYSNAPLLSMRQYNYNQVPPSPVSHANPYGGYPQPHSTSYPFVPAYMPPPTPVSSAGSRHTHPATPDSMTGDSPASVPSGKGYFEGFVNNTLARHVSQERPAPAQSQNGTPSNLPRHVISQEQLRGYNQYRSSPEIRPAPQSQPPNGQTPPQYPPQMSYSQSQPLHQAPGRVPFPSQPIFHQGVDKSATFPLVRGKSPAKRPSISSMAMRSPHPSSSVTSTPTHERVMSSPYPSSSPDPLGMPTPSPSKRPRKNRTFSPSLARSGNLANDNAMGIDSLSMRETSASVASSANGEEQKQKIMLRLPMHLATPQRPPAPEEGQDEDAEGDEEEDGVDWGDDGVRDAEGDWQMEEGNSSGTVYGGAAGAQIQMSGKTGERDTRNSWQKLQTLLEDISEENDSFTANPTLEDLQSSNIKFFGHVSRDGSQALLSQKTMSKVVRYVLRVQSGKKRPGQEANGPERVWDVTLVSTLLRLLERSIRDVENIVVFPDDRKAAVAIEEKAAKKKGKGKAGSASPVKPEDSEVKAEIPLADIQACEDKLMRVKRSVAAAECSLILLDSEGISKQLYSEELLSTCVKTVKDQLEQVVLPVIQGLAGDKIGSSYLARLVEQEHNAVALKSKLPMPLSSHFHHHTISAIAQSICITLPRLTSLISRDDFHFSEGLLIQTVYLAKGPLFVVDPVVGKKKGDKDGMAVVKSMRMEGLSLLRGVFARYEEQRQWIIEEVLSSLVGQAGQSHDQALFQLSNGKSIHAVSALLLQLIQASAYGAVAQVKKVHTASTEMEVLDRQETEKVDTVAEESRICSETIESALKSATMVAGYILSKATTTRATKTSLDTDYKVILSLFINDLLAVLYRPEWPSASLYLSVFTKIMINALDEKKTGTEATAAKGVALDYLADIVARLKNLSIEMLGEIKVATIDEVISEASVTGLTRLIKAQGSIRAFLTSAARDDGSFACSLDMASIMWAQELQAGVKKTASVLEKLAIEKNDETKELGDNLRTIGSMLSDTLRGVWLSDDSLFEVNVPKQGEQAVQASIAVSRGRSLQGAIDPIIHTLLSTMSNTIIGLRTKALRGISSIVVVDPDVLRLPQIRHALEERLSDASPGVRDAAVELVGKYLIQKPELVPQYYHQIASRVMDTGLSVRKRVIKILKGIFATMENRKMQVDICCRMIALVDDKDPGIKSLSTKALVDMLFSGEGGDAARLFVDILSNYRGSYEVLEKALDEVSKECESVGQKGRFGTTIDDLINRLIDATEENDFDSLSHIRAIWLLAESDPSQIDMQKANVLLGYLRPPANADDQATNELILKVFQRSIPAMPRTASTFANSLTKTLMPMISKPAGGFTALREIIGCFCAVINHLTKDWPKAINVLRACEGKIRSVRPGVKNGSVTTLNPAIAMMLYITALLVEGCNLDEIAKQDDAIDAQVRRISSQPLAVYFFELYLDFASMSTPHSAPTICLGALFRAYPSLLQLPETTEWMEKTFESNDMDGQCRLLGVLHQFLSSEVKKRASAGVANKDVSLLIGNSKELQDSDYSTVIVQNNIEQIFKCARSQHVPTQNAALDVLTFVVNQGLYSPVHTVPILVTLETAEDPIIAERALALHSTLHDKHANLIHVLFMDSARASYQYQRGITAEPSGHRNRIALLSSWYEMLSEKRTWRHDFLKALCRVFDSDLDAEVDIGFVLYIAENLATMDYKLQEEPMTVVQALSRIVSTCSHLATLMEEAHIDAPPEESIDGQAINLGKLSGETIKAGRLADASIIVGLALTLKNHLVSLYHLQEDKCAAHVPGKKSATGDKPTQRRGIQVLDLNRMPMVRGITTVGDFKQQQTAFLELLKEDGTLSENGD